MTDSLTEGKEEFEIFKASMGLGVGLALPFALIGGLITQRDMSYDLSKLGFNAKREKVKNLIKEYSER